jgi:hypothetical protein
MDIANAAGIRGRTTAAVSPRRFPLLEDMGYALLGNGPQERAQDFQGAAGLVLSLDGVLAPNLKVAIDERNCASHGGRLRCPDFSPSRRGDILGLVTRCLPRGIFLRLIRRIAIRQRGLSNRDLVQLGARRAIAIDCSDYGIGFHKHDWYSRAGSVNKPEYAGRQFSTVFFRHHKPACLRHPSTGPSFGWGFLFVRSS